jgi:hypothetical protein
MTAFGCCAVLRGLRREEAHLDDAPIKLPRNGALGMSVADAPLTCLTEAVCSAGHVG